MFKSIQWKLVLLYLLLVLFIITIISILLLNQVESLYYDNFEKSIKGGMYAAHFLDVNINDENMDKLIEKVDFYSSMFLIDSNVRNIYVLDNFGTVKYGGKYFPQKDIDKKQFSYSANVRKAILNQVGDSINLKGDLDYAQPVVTKDGSHYIIYITDNKTDLANSLNKVKKSIIFSISLSLLIAIVIGFLFARTITVPIKNLAVKARKIASGDFEQRIEEKSQDEIGELTKDFNFMALELKNTLREISNEKSKVEAILTNMTDGVIAFDQTGKVIHINPAAKNIINMDILNKDFDKIFEELEIDITIGEFIYLNNTAIRERKTQIGDTHVKLSFVSFRDKKGEVGGILTVLQDITEQQRLDNMRREFVANVSHELRTPLTTIKSYAETLSDGSIEDDQTKSEFLGVIEAESDRMTRIVKDLLELSKIDYQQVEWKREEISLDILTKEVLKKLNIEAKNKEIEIEYAVMSEIPPVFVDRDKIQQVLINIIGNAIKYTPNNGKISVYLGSVYEEVYIKVIDTGIGIPKKDLPRIFERFYRVDKARTRELGGTGLGLAIAKEIIEAHGGNISVNSQFGKGTEVVINLPFYKQI